MKKRFTEEQIIGFSCGAEAGVPVKDPRCVDQWRLRKISLRDDNQGDFFPIGEIPA